MKMLYMVYILKLNHLNLLSLQLYPKVKLIIAINAIKTNNIAATFAANFKPSVVPVAIASKTFEPILSFVTSTSVFNYSV